MAIKYATPQCWQCDKFQAGQGNTIDGFCPEAAKELKLAGYPIMETSIKVHGDGDATNCAGQFYPTPKALAELLADDFTVTYAPAEVWQKMREMRELDAEDSDDVCSGDPHEGMSSQPRSAAEWAGKQAS